jgi:hypothetical protein
MCLLLYKPANVEFSDVELRDFYNHNSDGFGVMYVEDGRVVTHKIVAKFKKVRRLYRQVAAGRECALHFRYRTHGPVTRANAHPHKVAEDVWMMHNGVLSGYGDVARGALKGESDTAHFSRELATFLGNEPGAITHKNWLRSVGEVIGSSNRMIFLSPQTGYQIVNEHCGRWHGGAWYSNDYAWSSPYWKTFTNYTNWTNYNSAAAQSIYDQGDDLGAEEGSAERAASPWDSESIWEVPMDCEEENSVADLLAWAESHGSSRDALKALEAPDYAVNMIANMNGEDAWRRDAIADFLWAALPLIRREFSPAPTPTAQPVAKLLTAKL